MTAYISNRERYNRVLEAETKRKELAAKAHPPIIGTPKTIYTDQPYERDDAHKIDGQEPSPGHFYRVTADIKDQNKRLLLSYGAEINAQKVRALRLNHVSEIPVKEVKKE